MLRTLFMALLFTPVLFTPVLWAQAQTDEKPPFEGRIYDVKHQAFISESALVDALAEASFVLIGEKHDNDTHHVIEARLVRALAARPGDTAVVLEMLQPTQEKRLQGALAQRGDLLRDTIRWNQEAWPWQAYGPVIEAALDAGATLLAGNIERETLMGIYRSNALPADTPYDTARTIDDDVRNRMLDALYDEHCEVMARARLEPMMLIQLARDAVMANAMVTADVTRRVLISGAYHAGRQDGVPLHLAQRMPDSKAAVLLLLEARGMTDSAALNDYSGDADYLWLTPAAPEKDYCAGLKPST